MADKDSPLDGLFDGKQRIITFYDVTDGNQIGDEIIADSLSYELPIAENSLRFDEGYDKLVDPFPSDRMSFSFYCGPPEFKKWLEDNPLTLAQKMIDELNEDLKDLHKNNPTFNRSERRRRMREISKKFKRLKAYCKKYHIKYEIKR